MKIMENRLKLVACILPAVMVFLYNQIPNQQVIQP